MASNVHNDGGGVEELGADVHEGVHGVLRGGGDQVPDAQEVDHPVAGEEDDLEHHRDTLTNLLSPKSL